jgi:hypothetical protein
MMFLQSLILKPVPKVKPTTLSCFLIVCFACFHLTAMSGGNLAGSETITKQIRPTDDTYVYGRGGAEAGIIRGLDDMNFLKSYYNGNRAWAFETYLKFDLSAMNSNPDLTDRVILKLYGADDNGDNHTINLFDMSGTVWDEDNLNYNSIAATGNKTLITSITTNMGTAQWYSWDITNYVKNKINSGSKVICLMLCDNVTLKKANGTTNVIVSFHSKENSSGFAPILEVTEKSFAALLLNEISINGEPLAGFQSTKYGYTVVLPAKQTVIPQISATAANTNATVTVIPATSLTGTSAERTTKIRVSVNDQTLEYQVVFEKSLLNNSTKLNSIKVDGLALDFYDKEKRNYNCYLPYTQNPAQNPAVTFEAENPDQQITIVPAANLTGNETQRTCFVRVTSGDETSTADYKIVYQILPELDLFLFIGQSNMAGRGYMNEAAGDLNPINNTYLLTPGLNWETASNPLNKYSSIRKELSMQRIGPAYGFALNVLGKTSNPVGLIVNAQGGSSMAQWTKGSIDALYEKTLIRAKEAQKWGKIRAILWHQGESNSSSTAVSAYPNQLKAMVDNFKADLNEPDLYVVAGELAYWRGGGTGSNAFNTMIRTISTFIPNSDYVSADGLTPLIDNTDPHFDRASNIELGKRYADKILNKIYSPTAVTSQSTINASTVIRIDKKKVIIEPVISDSQVTVSDVSGRTISKRFVTLNSSIEMVLSEGIYLVSVHGSEGVKTQKIIIQ